MNQVIAVGVGVAIILIAAGITGFATLLVRLRDDIKHIKYELSMNGGTDTLKDRVALVQLQVHDLQAAVEHIQENC